jgi:hypothetical protein
MTCGLCKQPIRGYEHYVTEHYKCSTQLNESWSDDVAKAERERDAIAEALRGIIEIGKRDMSNPKYDGYFESARVALASMKA